MVAIDRTPDFRDALRDAQRLQPEPKRRKTQKTSQDAFTENQATLNKEYLAEGYAIVSSNAVSLMFTLVHTSLHTAQPHHDPHPHASFHTKALSKCGRTTSPTIPPGIS